MFLSSQEQEEVNRRHEEEVKTLHQKLDLYSDSSLDRFKQNTLVSVCVCMCVCAQSNCSVS